MIVRGTRAAKKRSQSAFVVITSEKATRHQHTYILLQLKLLLLIMIMYIGLLTGCSSA